MAVQTPEKEQAGGGGFNADNVNAIWGNINDTLSVFVNGFGPNGGSGGGNQQSPNNNGWGVQQQAPQGQQPQVGGPAYVPHTPPITERTQPVDDELKDLFDAIEEGVERTQQADNDLMEWADGLVTTDEEAQQISDIGRRELARSSGTALIPDTGGAGSTTLTAEVISRLVERAGSKLLSKAVGFLWGRPRNDRQEAATFVKLMTNQSFLWRMLAHIGAIPVNLKQEVHWCRLADYEWESVLDENMRAAIYFMELNTAPFGKKANPTIQKYFTLLQIYTQRQVFGHTTARCHRTDEWLLDETKAAMAEIDAQQRGATPWFN